MSHPRALLAAAALAVVALPAAADAAKADAFAGKIQPVSGQLYQKRLRFELTPTGNLSLNDAFYRKTFGGVKAGFHFSEHWSVHASFAMGGASATGSAVRCESGAGCEDATDAQLYQVPGRILMIAGGEVAWSPVYGKMSLLAERVAHFDVSILAGADFIQHEQILGAGAAEELVASGKEPPRESTVGGHVGLGVRIFFTPWLATRLEVKDYVYQVEVPNWIEDGAPRKDIQNQIFAEVGLSFFLPFHNRDAR
ncbi:MAG TPA: outer membrane beta-barrel domain-containing protein [Anaeromyxobacteraceae bacterium]|nr:outer membrane beta-barrel domain-containing protein [Anaeromyxobacteraceae bacterium]